MGKMKYSVQASLFMRVGSSKEIEKSYRTKTLRFGCAANWLDYALNQNNTSTGDIFECVFAHVMKDDSRIKKIVDVKGKPMGDNLLIMENKNDATCLLRFEPTILIPTLCLYSFRVPAIIDELDKTGPKTTWFAFDLDKYRAAMDYTENESSFLFITDPVAFFEDLRAAIPMAVRQNQENLTSDRFYGEFNPKEPFFCKDVNYDHHTKSELFFDPPETLGELFWKLPEYKDQSEIRIIIPNTNFVQIYDPNHQQYDYKKNTLDIELPNFQKYVVILPAKDAHSLYFGNFMSSGHKYDFAVLRMTFDDIRKQSLEKPDGFILR